MLIMPTSVAAVSCHAVSPEFRNGSAGTYGLGASAKRNNGKYPPPGAFWDLTVAQVSTRAIRQPRNCQPACRSIGTTVRSRMGRLSEHTFRMDGYLAPGR